MADALVVMLTNARLDKKNLWGIVFFIRKTSLLLPRR